MQRSSAIAYSELSAHQYVCNTLLTNPILLIGEPKCSDRASMQPFSLFHASDINVFGFGNDTLVLIPQESPFHQDDFRGKEIISFTAFYLPFAKNQCVQIETPSEAEIIITPSLSGCSFVGELNSSNPVIAHINRLQGDKTDPLAMEEDIQGIIHSSNNYFIVRKRDYYDEQGNSTTLVFGLKLQHTWQFICQTVANNQVTQLITTFANKHIVLEQDSRLRLIKLRDKIYYHLIHHRDLYQNKNIGKRVIFSILNNTVQLQTYHFWVSENIHQYLKIISRAQTGQLSWSRAEQMLSFMKLQYTVSPVPDKSVSQSVLAFFSTEEQRQYKDSIAQSRKNQKRL